MDQPAAARRGLTLCHHSLNNGTHAAVTAPEQQAEQLASDGIDVCTPHHKDHGRHEDDNHSPGRRVHEIPELRGLVVSIDLGAVHHFDSEDH